jgi:uracil-DNA glycosylase family 4
MVIGQDYGTKEEGDALEVCKYADTTNPTDVRLKKLFEGAFGFNIDSDEIPLFFTNMANCYRMQRTSGGMHSAWLPLCANKFMSRLIRIIQPKIIIVLGRVAFEALYCMEDLPITCLNPESGKAKDSFSEMIRFDYELDLDGKKIGVFPVFHPGSNSRMNRTEEQQLDDWKRIAEYYRG